MYCGHSAASNHQESGQEAKLQGIAAPLPSLLQSHQLVTGVFATNHENIKRERKKLKLTKPRAISFYNTAKEMQNHSNNITESNL